MVNWNNSSSTKYSDIIFNDPYQTTTNYFVDTTDFTSVRGYSSYQSTPVSTNKVRFRITWSTDSLTELGPFLGKIRHFSDPGDWSQAINCTWELYFKHINVQEPEPEPEP